MTRDESKNHGENLTIFFSVFDSLFGKCLIASTEKGVCNILFADTVKEAENDLKKRWPKAKIQKSTKPEHEKIKKYFSDPKKFPIPEISFHLRGTPFQLKVWEKLLQLAPSGSVTSYGVIAEKLGGKNMSRAVGAAVGQNPIGYLIPCHRVIKGTGEIGEYHWGSSRKEKMLQYEASQERAYRRKKVIERQQIHSTKN